MFTFEFIQSLACLLLPCGFGFFVDLVLKWPVCIVNLLFERTELKKVRRNAFWLFTVVLYCSS